MPTCWSAGLAAGSPPPSPRTPCSPPKEHVAEPASSGSAASVSDVLVPVETEFCPSSMMHVSWPNLAKKQVGGCDVAFLTGLSGRPPNWSGDSWVTGQDSISGRAGTVHLWFGDVGAWHKQLHFGPIVLFFTINRTLRLKAVVCPAVGGCCLHCHHTSLGTNGVSMRALEPEVPMGSKQTDRGRWTSVILS